VPEFDVIVAVLDSCVLFKSRVSRLFCNAANQGVCALKWSVRIIEDARRNLAAQGRVSALQALAQTLNLIRDPLIEDDGQTYDLGSTDENDRHVLATAAACSAQYLVTANVADFDEAAARTLGIAIISPDDFGMVLAETNLSGLARGVDRAPLERLSKFLEGLKFELPRTHAVLVEVFAEDLREPPLSSW
jgi:predicted nucleic acid-binding protein